MPRRTAGPVPRVAGYHVMPAGDRPRLAGVVIHETALWTLIVACCIGGVLFACRVELLERRHTPPRPALARIGRVADAAMLGLGFGMAVASVVVIAAAIFVRLAH